MSLLQISEPGQTPQPFTRRRAAGIDLGTTYSLVATMIDDKINVLADENGKMLLPSVVLYTSDGIIVGQHARCEAARYPLDTLISIKRLIGRSLNEIQVRYPQLPYTFHASENGHPLIATSCGRISPIQFSAEILRVLADRARHTLKGELDGVVITVPAYFDEAQRQSTKEAAELAGLNVLRLLNEPTAAAIAYGLDSGKEGSIVVYDLGGGTFDISVLRLSRGVFEVLATGGDPALGGDDFDHQLANWIQMQSGIETKNDAQLQRECLDAALAAKISLSEQESVFVSFGQWQGQVTRETFESLIQDLVKRTLFVCRRTLKDAGVSVDEIQEIVMVGGATRVPLVRSCVHEFFGKMPLTDIDPDKVVAIGAAIQADILVGNKPGNDMLLLDVIPLSLGLETMGGLVEKIIPRNTTIPVARRQTFTTFKDGQTAMRLHVLQGERERVEDCRSLAHFTLENIPPLPAGAAHIDVTFQVDADGLLSVSALEKSTGIEASIMVRPSWGLTERDISGMIQEAMQNAHIDKALRLLAENKVEGSRLLESVNQALSKDKTLLSEEEYSRIQAAIKALQSALEGDEPEIIEQAIKTLDVTTQYFAQRRMNNAIQKKLTGRTVDEI